MDRDRLGIQHDAPLSQTDQATLHARALELRTVPTQEDAGASVWLAEFPVGNDRFAITLESLRAVLPIQAVTPVAMAPAHVMGMLRYDGRILAAMSLASLLGNRGWHQDPVVVVVVDPGWGRLVALDCEAIPRAMSVPAALVQTAQSEGANRAVWELHGRNVEQLNLINLQRLLDERTEVRRGN